MNDIIACGSELRFAVTLSKKELCFIVIRFPVSKDNLTTNTIECTYTNRQIGSDPSPLSVK